MTYPTDIYPDLPSNEGNGIWGLWELPWFSGGFHIWPLGNEECEWEEEVFEEPLLVGQIFSSIGLRMSNPRIEINA